MKRGTNGLKKTIRLGYEIMNVKKRDLVNWSKMPPITIRAAFLGRIARKQEHEKDTKLTMIKL